MFEKKSEAIHFNLEDTHGGMIDRVGEPVKPSSKRSRDSFRHRGGMEDNVLPVITITFDTHIGDEKMTGKLHKDLTPGG